MNFTTTRPTASKGKVKCFRCRELVAAKEGKWASAENGQVFVCAKCDQAARIAAATPARGPHMTGRPK